MSRLIALTLLWFRGGAQTMAPLLDLDLTVDGEATKLVLHEGQAYIDAARAACSATKEAAATDNCVSGAVSLIVAMHLRKKDASADSLASPGLSLVREMLQNYDPASFIGISPLHVDIELPIQTRRTVCDDSKCWELDAADGMPASNHTLQVPAWEASPAETAREVAKQLDLWRAEDVALIEHRVALERTRKATPVDLRLHRAPDDEPVVSFDGFYPPYFVLHNSGLYFDRVKVAGAFRPPVDGQVCISVVTLRDGAAPASESPTEACFDQQYNAELSGFEDAKGTHRLSARLRDVETGETRGDGDSSTFVAAPALKPTPATGVSSKFIELLRNAVIGWLYMENAGDDPGAAGPLSAGWQGHTMVGASKLNWLHAMIETLVSDGVPGDIVECGAWRGGASIFTKGVLDALEPAGSRRVFVADTFVGFPKASDGVDTDGWALQNFAVGGGEAVQKTFERYGLWDPDRVVLLAGLFNETLPAADIHRIALLRMDCDMYEPFLTADRRRRTLGAARFCAGTGRRWTR
ncbi:hypothetical protein M885DRAFT_23232 [Pelagophyceae sp. CCMP2097]|nr:hypothetical protein M885DRAFT_23232 [Pelagophyceae sp. CCMP2097]